MKREVSSEVVVGVIAVVVIIAGALLWWNFAGPSVRIASDDVAHPHPGAARERAAEFRAAHQRRPRGMMPMNGGQ